MAKAKVKSRLTAEEWFERANQFETASHALMEGLPREASLTLGIPHVVLRAFGVEAFFKCLIELDGREAPHWHNLHRLFTKLRAEDQRELRRRWKAEYAPKMAAWNKQKGKKSMVRRLPVSLDGILRLGGDAFVLFRYAVSDGVAGFVLMNFPFKIREYILELKPELKAKLGNVRLVDPEAKLVETKDDIVPSLEAFFAELNRQAAPFDLKFRRPTDPKDRRAK